MSNSSIKKNYLKKIKLLNKYNKFYHDRSNPIVSDKEYDQLKEELGNKKYQTLKTKGKITKLESKLQEKEATLYQLLKDFPLYYNDHHHQLTLLILLLLLTYSYLSMQVYQN